MEIIKYPDKKVWETLLKRPLFETASLEEKVKAVLADVKSNGDAALKKYTKMFDKVELTSFEVSSLEMDTAGNNIDSNLKIAINIAKENIETFHSAQQNKIQVIETTKGVKCWQKSVPVEKVGLYIPGGTAPLFSSVLMLGIPAIIAGCKEIVLCTPPNETGNINPIILYTAKLVGITKVFKVGGSQAIAAMAYGTETIPKVYKIFGPGNQYVTVAKKLVNIDDVAIDMPAGPSEVAIMADYSSNPKFLAADLLSQAEHGSDSQVILITTDEFLIGKIQKELEYQLEQIPRKQFAVQSLKNSKIILVNTDNEMIDIINEYAPEHLIISTSRYREHAEKIVNAGSVFLGNYTPESAGDYASGTNHTLPTNGLARVYNGTNLDDYVKKITFQEISEEGIVNLGPVIEKMAEAEQLTAHKNAVTIRLQNILDIEEQKLYPFIS
ncbi:MAG: histidinol dehydrogenase [Bacteroidales bacterium]|nr:histidinol dehydrogenase [Bacteroidales bacterium]